MSMTDRLTQEDPLRAGAEPLMLVRLVGLIRQWCGRARQRRALRALDDHLLDDIGIGRAEAEKEARRPFWEPCIHDGMWKSKQQGERND